MDVDGALTDEESRRDVPIGPTVGKDVEDLPLARAETIRICGSTT